jgi:FMN reductase
MVVDDHMRPLFAFLRALPVPTSLFAAPDDRASPSFTRRIERAAGELAHLVDPGIRTTLADAGWDGYQHRFAGNATRSQQSADDVDFDTDLMRPATGGASRPAR